MIEFLIKHSPTIGLLIFFSFFCYIIWIVAKPGAKKKLNEFSQIPFKDENPEIAKAKTAIKTTAKTKNKKVTNAKRSRKK